MATQNPIEMEGTYPLPEAQLDRFLYKINIPYPPQQELVEIARRTTGRKPPEAGMVVDGAGLIGMQTLAREVPVADEVYQYAARLVGSTHPESSGAPEEVRRHLRVGASPRGMQAMIQAGKVTALLENRKAVSIEDVRRSAYPALRHRLIMKFEALAEGVNPDAVIEAVIKRVGV
jgi:MoxR-like ATPase